MRLEGKVAVVTGAAGGIGRAIAELFAEHGAIVYAADVELIKSRDSIRGVIHDVSQDDQWRSLIQQIATFEELQQPCGTSFSLRPDLSLHPDDSRTAASLFHRVRMFPRSARRTVALPDSTQIV